MWELLPGKVGLLQHMATLDNTETLSSLPAYARTKLHEVNSMLSWVSCFTMYIAVLGQWHPHLIQSCLAYLAFTVAKTRRDGAEAWQPYDMVFWKHAASDHTVEWSALTTPCTPLPLVATNWASSAYPVQGRPLHRGLHNEGSDNATSTGMPSSASSHLFPSHPICLYWNRGKCGLTGATATLAPDAWATPGHALSDHRPGVSLQASPPSTAVALHCSSPAGRSTSFVSATNSTQEKGLALIHTCLA